jgi:hypothetical protein
MAITLLIKGTPVSIPNSGESPNWSEGIIDALTALTEAVNAITGTYDVAPQVQNIDANNASTDVNIANLVFPVSEVRSAVIYYTVHRETEDSGSGDAQEMVEGGTLTIVYNAANSVGNKWELVRVAAGSANITFEVTDVGQVQFTTTALTGINHTGTLSFRAISILNT